MKLCLAVLVCALFVVANGRSCPNVYKCVESYEHCKKVTKCEEPKKVECGEEYCTYPDVCDYVTKKLCQDVTTYKKACESAKVCKEVLTKCGDEKCKYDEECTKETVCDIADGPHGSSKTSASALASIFSFGGDDDDDGALAHASATAIANGGWFYEPTKVCNDVYSCTPKDPCKKVTTVACVGEVLKEGHDYEGYSFVWHDDWQVGYKCGKDFCEPGHKCAIITTKDCPKGPHCGDHICDPGYKCIDDVACKKIPATKTVCQKVNFPICVESEDYIKYEPVCKQVWECHGEIPCGRYYCKAGTACHVSKGSCPRKRGGGSSSEGDD